MSNEKKSGEMPANKQKGKKKCTCCGQEKNIVNGFYSSNSPLYAVDRRVPICKDCIRDLCIDKDTGEINEIELNKTLRIVQKPYFKDDLASAYAQFKKEHSYVTDEDLKKYGDKILGLYFKNTMLRQNKDLSYEDSENMGFMHQNSNITISKKKEISNKYSDVSCVNQDNDLGKMGKVVWSEKDTQNMNYAISMIGYNPFEDAGLSDSDKKYCFNILSGYCDTDGVTEDGNKMQGVIEITMMYCQCKKITETMNIELSKRYVDDAKIAKLTSAKSSLLSSISTIAKDNNIASNYNKNSKQGQSSLTAKMKEMSENNFEAIKVNLFDIKTSEAFKQIADLSNQSIMDQLTLDNNDYVEVVKEQRDIIQKQESDLDALREENRNLKNKIIDLENGKE